MSLGNAVLAIADKMEANAKEIADGNLITSGGGPLILYALALRMAVKAAETGLILTSEDYRGAARVKEDMTRLSKLEIHPTENRMD